GRLVGEPGRAVRVRAPGARRTCPAAGHVDGAQVLHDAEAGLRGGQRRRVRGEHHSHHVAGVRAGRAHDRGLQPEGLRVTRPSPQTHLQWMRLAEKRMALLERRAARKGGAGGDGTPGPPGTDGKPGLVWQGPWVAGTTYAVGDAVSYVG